jgi:hypothetical protein
VQLSPLLSPRSSDATRRLLTIRAVRQPFDQWRRQASRAQRVTAWCLRSSRTSSTLEAYETAIVASDTVTLKQIWSEDYTFINPQGGLVTRAERLANLASGATNVVEGVNQREIVVPPYTLLLQPAMRGGTRVREPQPLSAARDRVQSELTGFHAGIKRLVNPHRYPVGLERGLHEQRTALVLAARSEVSEPDGP